MFPLFATGVIVAAGVVDTGGKLPPLSQIPAANLPPVSTTLAKLVAKFAAGVADTGGKVAAGVVDTGSNFAAGVVDTGGNFAAGVVDTGGKFATGVVDIGGAPYLRISPRIFEKIRNGPNGILWGASIRRSFAETSLLYYLILL